MPAPAIPFHPNVEIRTTTASEAFGDIAVLLIAEPDPEDWRPNRYTQGLIRRYRKLYTAFADPYYESGDANMMRIWVGPGDAKDIISKRPALYGFVGHDAQIVLANYLSFPYDTNWTLINLAMLLRGWKRDTSKEHPVGINGNKLGVLGGVWEHEIPLVANLGVECGWDVVALKGFCLTIADLDDIDATIEDIHHDRMRRQRGAPPRDASLN